MHRLGENIRHDTFSFNPTDIIQYCFLSLLGSFRRQLCSSNIVSFCVDMKPINAKIFYYILFHFASTMPTQNEIKNHNEKKIFHYFILSCIRPFMRVAGIFGGA